MSDECRKAFEESEFYDKYWNDFNDHDLKVWQAAWSARGNGWVSVATVNRIAPGRSEVVFNENFTGEERILWAQKPLPEPPKGEK